MSSPGVLVRRAGAEPRGAAPAVRQIGGSGWRRTDLVVLAVTFGLCLLGLVIAYQGAAHTTRYSRQTDWVAVGGASIMVGGLGAAYWILEGLRANHRRASRLRARAARLGLHESAAVELAADAVMSTSGMKRYHRPSCRLVAGKPAVAMPLGAATSAGLTACGMCRP